MVDVAPHNQGYHQYSPIIEPISEFFISTMNNGLHCPLRVKGLTTKKKFEVHWPCPNEKACAYNDW